MVAAGERGVIVNLSSVAGTRAGLAPAAYTASKHGIVGLMRQAAAELAPHGIRVNCVSPSAADTVSMTCPRRCGIVIVVVLVVINFVTVIALVVLLSSSSSHHLVAVAVAAAASLDVHKVCIKV
jgi:short-subunit dehydrogenase